MIVGSTITSVSILNNIPIKDTYRDARLGMRKCSLYFIIGYDTLVGMSQEMEESECFDVFLESTRNVTSITVVASVGKV